MPMTSPLAMTAATPIASKILVQTPAYVKKTGYFTSSWTKLVNLADVLNIQSQ